MSNKLSEKIIGCAIEVHRFCGPGMLESVYKKCLHHELKSAGLKVEQEKPVSFKYKDVDLDVNFCIDLMVEDSIILELKCVSTILPVHEAQLVNYLKISGMPLGLLINFNVAKLTDGIRRKINL